MFQVVAVQRVWLRNLVSRLTSDELGQDMIEYALLVSLITIPLLVAILAIGPYIENTFQNVVNGLATPH